MELGPGLFHAVLGHRTAGRGRCVVDVEHHHDIGHQTPGGEVADRRHGFHTQAAADTLVDERRRRIPITHHHSAACQCRKHDLGHVLRAVGRHHEQFRALGEWRLVGEQEPTQRGAARRGTGFERGDDIVTGVAEVLDQRADLGALPAAFATFEHDEHPGHATSVPRTDPATVPERPGWPGVRCYGSVPMAIGSGSGDEAEGSVVTARIRRSLKIAVALFALYYIALPAGLTAWTNVGRLRDIQPMYLLVGVGLEMMALVAYAQLMRVALPDGSISLFRMVRIQLATKSLTNVVPGGSAAGAALGYRLLTTNGVDGPDTGFALAATGLVSACILNVILWVSLLLSIPFHGYNALYGFAIMAGAFVIGFAVALAFATMYGSAQTRRIVEALTRRFKFIDPDRVTEIIEQIARRLREIVSDRDLVVRAAIWATLNWVLDAMSLWVFLRAFGSLTNVLGLFVAFGLANVIAVIPLTPGGLGIVEGVLIPTLVGFGVTKGVATAGVLSYRIAAFWLPIPLGAVSYITVRRDRTAANLRQTARAAYATTESRFDWAEEYGHRPRAERPKPDDD